MMEEQQFELTCRTKVNVTTESDSDKSLEPTISGEPTTINVTKQIGQEHATPTRFTGTQGNNTSGENATKHTTMIQKRLTQHMRLSPSTHLGSASTRRSEQCMMARF